MSGLKKDTISKAKSILNRLKPEIEQLDELRKKGLNADYDAVGAANSKISKISSEFYQIIPKNEHKDDLIKPINSLQNLKNVYDMLDSLSNIEFSSRLLLGALYRQYQYNPINYIYENMGVRIQALSKGDPECDLIR